MPQIHPTAFVHPTAQIDSTVTIGAYSTIASQVTIGEGTSIASHVRIDKGSRIGNHCSVHHGAVIGTLPQSIAHDPREETYCVIGDYVEIREFCTVNRATKESRTTRIAHYTRMLPYSHVAHDCHIGEHVTLSDFVQLGGHVHIGNHTIMRMMSAAHQFSNIGTYCDIAAMARKDIPPFTRFGHHHAAFEGVTVDLLREHHFDENTVREIEHAYKILYQSGLNFSDGVKELRNLLPEKKHIGEIVHFVESSKRGIVKGSRS